MAHDVAPDPDDLILLDKDQPVAEGDVACVADVPEDVWSYYEDLAKSLGEPPDTPAPRGEELV